MKMSKARGIGYVVALAILGAPAAFGQEVQSTRVASPRDVISKQTANIELRNYYKAGANPNEDKLSSHDMINQARTNIGIGAFKDRLNSTLTLGASSVRSAGAGVVSLRRPELNTSLAAVSTDYFDLSPYTSIFFPDKSAPTEGTRTEVGLNPVLKAPAIDAPFGSIALSFAVEAETKLYSKKQAEKTKNKVADEEKAESLGLTTDEEGNQKLKEGQGSPGYAIMYSPSIAVDLKNVAKGLTVRPFVEYSEEFTAVYEVDEVDGSKTRSYEKASSTGTNFEVAYQINDKVKVANLMTAYHKGLYEKRGDDKNTRFQNLALVSYTIY